MSNRKKAIPNFFILIVLAAGIAWVCGRFLRISSDEYTDNAQVKQHLTPVNTRVQGFIKKIYFEEYQKVKKGDTLVVIEDVEYRLKVAQTEADYHNALVGKGKRREGLQALSGTCKGRSCNTTAVRPSKN